MKTVFVRSPYNYDMNKAGDESALHCKDPSRAKQEFAEEADINTIVKRFNLTGQLPENVRMPTYGDFEGIFDFHSAMNAIAQANEAFDAMPAAVRARFHNNPAEFVDFCSDEKNREEATRLGLVRPGLAGTPGTGDPALDGPSGPQDGPKPKTPPKAPKAPETPPD